MDSNCYVTPQMYGAVADGVADDTDAFQRAVDSGYDVFVPTAKRETYRITRTITVTKKNCGRIFSDPFYGRSGKFGHILADFRNSSDPKNTALFDVNVCGITFGGLRFISDNDSSSRIGLFMRAMNESLCDYDIKIDRCAIRSFYRVFEFMGRGLEIMNGQIASCNHIANLYWDDAFDTNENHPAKYDQRAIAIKNCRLHSITNSFITVQSGHAYGLHFEGNTVDNGKGYLIRANEQAYGWNISGNVLQGIQGKFSFLDFRNGMANCVISGNTMLSDDGYWVDSEGYVQCWLKCGGKMVGSLVCNNVFKNVDGSFMELNRLDGSVISGNVMFTRSDTEQPAIVIGETCKRCTMVGNAASGNKAIPLLNKKNPAGIKLAGNYPDT